MKRLFGIGLVVLMAFVTAAVADEELPAPDQKAEEIAAGCMDEICVVCPAKPRLLSTLKASVQTLKSRMCKPQCEPCVEVKCEPKCEPCAEVKCEPKCRFSRIKCLVSKVRTRRCCK